MPASSAENPFIYGRPVRPNEFYDRYDSLRTVFNRLRMAESTAIVGEPHIGKSSLLMKIAEGDTQKRYLGDLASKICVTHIDLQPISSEYSPVQFWDEALEDLAFTVDDDEVSRRLNLAKERRYGRRSLERLFSYLGNQDRRVVLLLDEFEQLVRHVNFRESNFFPMLRSFSTLTGGLVLIPASRLTVAEMNASSVGLLPTGSPFFNNIIEQRLGPFDEETMTALLKPGNGLLSEEDCQIINQVSGCHPFLVQAMAAALVDEQPGPARYERAVERFYQRIAFHFDDLWNFLDDRTRAAAVILSLLGLGGQSLGDEPGTEQDDWMEQLVGELRRLEGLGLAKRLAMEEPEQWRYPVQWQGERWTIAAQAFAWWVKEVVVTELRVVPDFEHWLASERFRSLLTQEQWAFLLKYVRAQSEQGDAVTDQQQPKLLYQLLVDGFEEEELKELVFMMQIKYSDLPGETLSGRIRELVNYCQRLNRVDELWQEACRMRPNLCEDQ